MKPALFHWLAQRITAVFLLPLSLWFVTSFVILLAAPFDQVQTWLTSPWHATFASLFVALVFYHGALGMQVIWEDYVKQPRPLIWLTNGVSVLFTLLGIAAILKVYLIS